MCVHAPEALHPSLTITRLAISSPPPCQPYSIPAQPCPSPRFFLSPWPHCLPPQQPASPLSPLLPIPSLGSHPPASSPSPIPRCLPPPFLPPPVSPGPALTWEVRGVGGRMTHSVMMQFHNTQLHSPTDRGTDERQPLAPQQLASWAAPVSSP